MQKVAVDRRVARTRMALKHALLTLIMRKGYDTITVEDICAEANVGRSTFYLHFASKDALKLSGLEHLREQLAARQQETLTSAAKGDGLDFGLALFQHAREHIDLYRALIGGKGEGIALDGIRRILADLVRAEFEATADGGASDAIAREIAVQYTVGAYMAVLAWWLDRGAEPSPERMNELVRRLTARGIWAY
ncbi:TetR/AcrR family transcriptional regulator [Oceaniradius stylonematis]|uniref:TetR/AcrR family transcriptional regulator n=1 Tax=Oceaniradius stylonematis TaxID=2184161 RepID=UPI00273F64A0|nr:TetR/AcrR family transcriptional regulator [Oceaniradius stylonematis]